MIYYQRKHIYTEEKKQAGCLNHGVVILVAAKLKTEQLWEVYFSIRDTRQPKRQAATLIILQPLSCMLIMTTNIYEGINCLYKSMKVPYSNFEVHL